MWEAVLLSISPSYMQIKLNEGGKVGKILKGFQDNIDVPLAAILTFNTIAHTVGAIGVGQQATKIWSEVNPVISGVVVPVAMTAAILILSEIIPKTIGATNWKVLAPFTVISLNILSKILFPIIWICQKITYIFNAKKGESIFSRLDFLAMAQIGSKEGHLEPMESSLIHNLLYLRNYKVKQIMTPRTVLVSASYDTTCREFYDEHDELMFSRILLRDTNEDEITGYVLKDEILKNIIDGKDDKPLRELKRDIIIVSEMYSALKLFNDFVEKREQLALIVDEYGGVAGLVTMEDIMESLIGAEIVDETDKIIDLQYYAKQVLGKKYKR